MTNQDTKTDVQVNSLIFFSLHPLGCQTMEAPGPPDPSSLLQDILPMSERARGLEGVVERHNEISPFDEKLNITLHDGQTLSEVVSVARAAKTLYVLGQYLACIALCGYIGEAIAMFLLDQVPIRVQKQPMTRPQFKKLFVRRAEQLSQERRLAILEVIIGLDASLLEKARKLTAIRNKHLHPGSPKKAAAKTDAARVYRLAVELTEPFAKLNIGQEGRVVLSPGQTQYLRTLQTPEAS